jgi:ribosomal protein S21
MERVVVRKDGLDSALRMMKQRGIKNGSLKKVRERQEGYLKPGVKRRIRKEEARKNSRKKERRERSYN